jgi:hypothetical protein
LACAQVFPQSTFSGKFLFVNGETRALNLLQGDSGKITVPPGQSEMVIEMVGGAGAEFCNPRVYAASGGAQVIEYDKDSGFVCRCGRPGSLTVGGGIESWGRATRLSIPNPVPGDYVFAVWRLPVLIPNHSRQEVLA